MCPYCGFHTDLKEANFCPFDGNRFNSLSNLFGRVEALEKAIKTLQEKFKN